MFHYFLATKSQQGLLSIDNILSFLKVITMDKIDELRENEKKS